MVSTVSLEDEVVHKICFLELLVRSQKFIISTFYNGPFTKHWGIWLRLSYHVEF